MYGPELQGTATGVLRSNDNEGDCPAHHVVGIGASAGGLEALEQFFKNVPSDTGMSFVVVQHLSTDFKSHMEQLLARHTSLTIHRVENGMEVEPDSIYLIPPGKVMILSEGRLLLTDRDPAQALSLPIDHFLRSLALECGRYGIAVVLSGTGSDGSRGAREINDAGGLVAVQSPESAGFAGMPESAIETGAAHLITEPARMPDLLLRYVHDGALPEEIAEVAADLEGGDIQSIIDILEENYRIDFGHYKQTTVGRRIRRRMEFGNWDSIQKYADHVAADPAELNELYRDLLIGVTRFLRDEKAFQVLEREVLPTLLRKKRNGDTLRIWIPACATGEEAYTVAMLTRDAIERSRLDLGVKIFASDVHARSLNAAARGVYSAEAVEPLPERWRSRYFRRDGDEYRVESELRKSIVFAEHNLLSQPPFTQQDIVVCRNLLIYFRPSAQRRVVTLFHFALRTDGILFLGPSETLGDLADEFDVIDKRWRMFRKRRDVRLPMDQRAAAVPRLSVSHGRPISGSTRHAVDEKLRDANRLYASILEDHLPPSVVIDGNFNVLHMFGGFAKLLRMRGVVPTNNLLELVPESIRTTLSGAVTHAIRERDEVRYSGVRIDLGDGPVERTIIVAPLALHHAEHAEFMLKIVEPAAGEGDRAGSRPAGETTTSNIDQAAEAHVQNLEQELAYARENLQATVEELETSNEELQATNEELVAGNEELQSTNEELQSVNEELFTVNAEYQRKIDELERARNDMDNLLASTEVGVFFLDENYRVRRFTPELGRRFGLLESDVGSPVERLAYAFGLDQLEAPLRENLRDRGRYEIELTGRDGARYLLRAIPYRNSLGDDGVVGTLIDVSSLRRARAEAERFKFISDSSPDALAMVDVDGRIVYANDEFVRSHGLSRSDLESTDVAKLNPDWSLQRFRELFERVHAEGPQTLETTAYYEARDPYPVEVLFAPFDFAGDRVVFTQARDITERRRAEARAALEHRVSEVAAVARHAAFDTTAITDAFIEQLHFVGAELWTFPEGTTAHKIQVHPELRAQSLADDFPNAVAWRERTEKLDLLAATGPLGRALEGDGIEWLDGLSDVEGFERAELAEKARLEHICLVPLTDGSQTLGLLALYSRRPAPDRRALVQTLESVGRTLGQTLRRLDTDRALRLRDRAVDATQDGIVIADALAEDLPLVYVNSGFERTTGYAADDALGTNCRFLQGPETDRDVVEEIREALARKEEVRTVLLNYRKDGTPFWNELQISPVTADNGEVEHFVSVQHDVTERMEFERALDQARRDAQSASEAKSRFLANMSHEIRTPMAAILGFTDALREDVVSDDGRERLSVIKRNGDYLLQLINDVLDLSKVESGLLEVDVEETDLVALLSDVRELLAVRAEGSPAELVFEATTQLPQFVGTDPVRLRQILVNLVGNALKFTQKGRVAVRAALVPQDAPRQLRIDVEDTGIGISGDSLDSIFEPFRQIRNHGEVVRSDFGGTGLGLSITRRLAEALGGRIEVTSTLGEGSTFSVLLPVSTSELETLVDWDGSDPPAEAVGDDAIPDLGGCRVLVADDRKDVGRVAEFYLDDAGARVSVVYNGQEAVDAALAAQEEDDSFDVILMDIQMPVLDGLGATEKLRAAGYGGRVVALTAGAMPDEVERCYDVGCDAFLAKPVDEQTLLLTVAQQWSSRAGK